MPERYIKRTTLFKVPEKHIDSVLKQYEVLRKTAVKVGLFVLRHISFVCVSEV